MTLVLELDATTEARLKVEAEARGLAVEDYAVVVLRNSGSERELEPKRQSVEGLKAMFETLAKGSENRPVLPPEAFERESFYEDRW